MRRDRTVEFYRGIATMLVLLYHVWVYCEYPQTGYNIVLAYGGEIGVTLFFIISGFAIYTNIENQINKNGSLSYVQFIKQRYFKLAIPYYVCILIIMLFSNSHQYLLNSLHGYKDIFVHIFFIHNWFPSTHGSINGVCWTLGVIVQFYVIAPILYKMIKKKPILSGGISIIIAICFKMIIFNKLNPQGDGGQYFVYGRQLLGCIDNFIFGMLIAYFHGNIGEKLDKVHKNIKWICVGINAGAIYHILSMLNYHILYSNTLFGYIWHSILSFSLAIQIFIVMHMEFEFKNRIAQFLLYISKIEYNIYLWHLPILAVIIANPIIANLGIIERYYITLVIVLLVSIIWAVIYREMINGLISSKVIKSFIDREC